MRHPKTVRVHLARFNTQGIEGLGMREGSGRKPRLTEQERSQILGLVKQPPPGRLERYAETLEARDETGSAQWSLDALTQSAQEKGIQVKRELRSGGYTYARACAGVVLTVGGTATIKTSPAMRTAVVTHYTQPPAGSTTVCTDETADQ
jgi:transposase